MVRKVLEAIVCFSMLVCCGTLGAMDALTDDVMIRSEILGGVNWESVYNSTSNDVHHSSSTSAAYGGGGVVDWTDIKDDALKGSPIAQFCLYKYLYRMSGQYSNGIKEELRRNALMFLVISHVRGHLGKSKESLTYRTTPSLKSLNLSGSTKEIINKLQAVINEMLEFE